MDYVNHQWLAYFSLALAATAIVAELGLGGAGLLAAVAVLALMNGVALLWIEDAFWVTLSNTGFLILMAAMAVLLVLTVFLSWRLYRRRSVTGRHALLGATGAVLVVDRPGQGYAEVRGERWRIESDAPLRAGLQVEVIAVRGLTLQVKPLSS